MYGDIFMEHENTAIETITITDAHRPLPPIVPIGGEIDFQSVTYKVINYRQVIQETAGWGDSQPAYTYSHVYTVTQTP